MLESLRFILLQDRKEKHFEKQLHPQGWNNKYFMCLSCRATFIELLHWDLRNKSRHLFIRDKLINIDTNLDILVVIC